MSTPDTTAPTFNISIHVDTAPLAAAVTAIVERVLRLEAKP